MRRMTVAILLALAVWPASASALSEQTKDDFTVALRAATDRCGDQPGPNLRKVPGEPSSGRYHARTDWLLDQCPPPPPAPVSAPETGNQRSAPAPATGAGLEGIAGCESGGDPGAVSPDGTYRGKYQFDQQTWNSVGGSGDPAAAPEAEQDKRAAMLYAQRGAQPWPVCGK